ncbi:hypothetical protein CENSYa_1561 [Cenarchaeum symbiosum A]|uniref:Uncharacterized protein n=1 Tax=Cenarchaeum symbiosum (strain A) TaxID=414004 RepID=A0RXW4_CENSY|nr:hypothetical protein CENSYa_1561 [Cenarchaeum symbiosum A]
MRAWKLYRSYGTASCVNGRKPLLCIVPLRSSAIRYRAHLIVSPVLMDHILSPIVDIHINPLSRSYFASTLELV